MPAAHRSHDAVATLNQRRRRWFNVATTSCAQWVGLAGWLGYWFSLAVLCTWLMALQLSPGCHTYINDAAAPASAAAAAAAGRISRPDQSAPVSSGSLFFLSPRSRDRHPHSSSRAERAAALYHFIRDYIDGNLSCASGFLSRPAVVHPAGDSTAV